MKAGWRILGIALESFVTHFEVEVNTPMEHSGGKTGLVAINTDLYRELGNPQEWVFCDHGRAYQTKAVGGLRGGGWNGKE
jgi:hypothetical protein